MKRILVTILCILYMLSATGATVHMHYCMGKLVRAGLTHDQHDRCGKCGMKKEAQKKGCCKDEQKTYKSTDHQLAKASFKCANLHQPALIPYSWVQYTTGRQLVNNRTAQSINAPPRHWPSVPIYIQVRNFRI